MANFTNDPIPSEMKRTIFIGLLSCFSLGFSAFGQSTDTVNINYVSGFEFSWTYSSYTALFDQQQRPYIYTANSELGVITFDITDINDPTPIDTLWQIDFGTLKPQNLYLDNDLLYVALGGFQGLALQRAGLAIVDVSNPETPTILAQWDSTAYMQGAAVVEVANGVAYLGAMEEGVIILDVSNPSNISFMSVATLDDQFPHVPGLFSVPNARGLSIKGDTLIVCNDAGGLRMVDVSDPYNPIEVGKYVNWSLDSIAQPAYNNVLLVEDYAYVPVDYCGLDVVNVADTNMFNVHWHNPWACDPTNWNGRPGHTNQVRRVGDLIFVSGADTEVLVYDITDRENPIQVGLYANVGDSIVSWGIDANDQYICLALVDNSLAQIPYISDHGGIIILEWQSITSVQESEVGSFSVFPNPTNDRISLTFDHPKERTIVVSDQFGRILKSQVSRLTNVQLDLSDLEPGVYLISTDGDFGSAQKVVKN